MSKNKKKNQKKVHAKIDTKSTPAKAEATKKKESKVANKSTDKAVNAAMKEAKKLKQEKKYAASEARKKARNERKQTAKDMLNGVKHTKKNATPIKITLEDRKKHQEERRKIAYNRHIASIRRRCSRMNLSDAQTNAIVDKAKEQWDKAKFYNIVIICDSFNDKQDKLLDIVKKHSIKTASITNCTAFLNKVPKIAVDEIREMLTDATIYQYAEKVDLFESYKDGVNRNKKHQKKGGKPHSIECSKSRSVNFYNLRRLKKAEKEKIQKNTYNFRHGSKAEGRKKRRLLKKENAKSVNKKPTQVKTIKEKSNKQAA